MNFPSWFGPQNDCMRTISHTTTCPAIHMHLIYQFARIYSTCYSVKGHNRTMKSRSGDGSRHLGMWWTIVLHISWPTVKQCKKWFGPRVGLVLSRVHKLSYAKKSFFGSLNFFCENFPIKHCSTPNMWIRWSFRSISSSYFHRNIMYIGIFAHPRLTTYHLDWTRMLYKRK